MARKLRPLYDRVIVKRIESEEMTKGGIIIPDNAKEKPLEGEIIAVGKGKVLDDGSVREMTVKVGDRVLFAKWAETEIALDGDKHLLLKEDDLLAVVEK
jgi:chaperonin GroES